MSTEGDNATNGELDHSRPGTTDLVYFRSSVKRRAPIYARGPTNPRRESAGVPVADVLPIDGDMPDQPPRWSEFRQPL
jgi:hypothetical protein